MKKEIPQTPPGPRNDRGGNVGQRVTSELPPTRATVAEFGSFRKDPGPQATPAGAKARFISLALIGTAKAMPFQNWRKSRELHPSGPEGQFRGEALMYGLKPVPFKTEAIVGLSAACDPRRSRKREQKNAVWQCAGRKPVCPAHYQTAAESCRSAGSPAAGAQVLPKPEASA
jgi:hypothetical protein